MANLSFDTTAQYNHNGASSSSDTYTLGAGSNTLVLVSVLCDGARSVSAKTYNSVAMTLVGSQTNIVGSAPLSLFLYYLEGVATGAKTVAITLDGSSTIFIVNVSSYLNVQQQVPDQTVATSNQNNTTLQGSVTTTHYAEWLIGACVVGSGLNSVTNGISRSTGAASPNFAMIDSNAVLTPAGAQSLSSVQSANNTYAAVILASFIHPISLSLTETQSSTDSLSGIRKRFSSLSETLSTSDAVVKMLNRWRKDSIHTGTWTTESKST